MRDGTFTCGRLAAVAGLIGGLVLGLSARLGNFFTLGALETAAYGARLPPFAVVGHCAGVAILGTQFGAQFGYIDITASFYHTIAWNPVASIVGGLIFGYGMALAGNCGFGALARFGGGDMRALVIVVVMGIVGFIALSGPLAPLRTMLFPQPGAIGPQGILHSLSLIGLPPTLVIALLGLGALAWGLRTPRCARILR